MRYEALPKVIGLFLALSTLQNVVVGSVATRRHLDAVAEAYDYIIVGGGTSGLVLANRLSENPESKNSELRESVLY